MRDLMRSEVKFNSFLDELVAVDSGVTEFMSGEKAAPADRLSGLMKHLDTPKGIDRDKACQIYSEWLKASEKK